MLIYVLAETPSYLIAPTETVTVTIAPAIDVGGGPSGPSIEGPFCRTVHLCRTLEDRKMGKKGKKRKKIKKKKGKIEKRTERSEKKEKIAWI